MPRPKPVHTMTPVTTRIRVDSARRLRVAAGMAGRSTGQILDDLIQQHLPPVPLSLGGGSYLGPTLSVPTSPSVPPQVVAPPMVGRAKKGPGPVASKSIQGHSPEEQLPLSAAELKDEIKKLGSNQSKLAAAMAEIGFKVTPKAVSDWIVDGKVPKGRWGQVRKALDHIRSRANHK